MLLFFPLVFLKTIGRVHKNNILESPLTLEKTSSTSKLVPNSSGRPEFTIIDMHDLVENDYIYDNGKAPITATSTMLSGFSFLLPVKQSSKSRLAMFTFSMLTLVLPALEFVVCYVFVYDYTVDLANNNISIGLSGLVIGWEAKRMKFTIFGGPFIAIGLYLVIGWILMSIPKSMADHLYIGNVNASSEISNTSLNLSLQKKEELGSVRIRKHTNGYVRLFRVQMCHFYMLVNPEFWNLIGFIIKTRWHTFFSVLKSFISVRFIVYTRV